MVNDKYGKGGRDREDLPQYRRLILIIRSSMVNSMANHGLAVNSSLFSGGRYARSLPVEDMTPVCTCMLHVHVCLRTCVHACTLMCSRV